MAGSDVPFDDDPGLARRLLGGAVPAHIWNDEKVRAFAAGAAGTIRERGQTSTTTGMIIGRRR